jgi:translation initiation factor 1 (eIF-1/SUI1)
MGRQKKRISTSGGESLSGDNPFADLQLGDLPMAVESASAEPVPAVTQKAKIQRKETLLLRRLKAGKGGKVVTEISGFNGGYDLRPILRTLQQALATGGAEKGRILEIQGDRIPEVGAKLEEMGYVVKGKSA